MWEMVSRASPPSGHPPGWSHQPYLVDILKLGYLSIVSLAGSNSVTRKKWEIKSEKNTSPQRTLNAYDPAKRAVDRTRIERDMLNFRTGSSEHYECGAD